ncbi:PepSY domain-containing protein [Paenibacillus sp. Z6-24]
MIKRRWWLTGGIAALLIILCAGILVWRTLLQASPVLTAEEVNKRILAEYPGEITRLIQQGDTYEVRLQSERGVYELVLGAQNGEIRSINRLGGTNASVSSTAEAITPSGTAQTDTKPPASSSKPSDAVNSAKGQQSSSSSGAAADSTSEGSFSSTPPSNNNKGSSSAVSPSGVISAEKAEQIALQQVRGTVDDTDYEHGDKQGQRYYLVEIDTADDREATVQINAISGEVMSVTWDEADEPEA